MKNELSKKAVNLLEDNGYRVRITSDKVLIKRPYDYIAPIIIFILFAFVSIPLFSYSYWLGAMIFALLVVGMYLHRNLLSKASSLKIFLKESKIELNNRKGKRWFSYWYVRNLFIRSNYSGSYASADKETNEEYKIEIGVELKSGEFVEFVRLLSDYKEPSDEMNEIHDLFFHIIRKED